MALRPCLVRRQAGAQIGIAPVFQQIRLSAAVRFKGRWPLFQKGPDFYRRWRVFHAEPSCWRGSNAGRTFTSTPASRRCVRGPFQQTITLAGPPGTLRHALTPEKRLGDQAAECSSAKKLNACLPDASTHKSWRRDGEKAVMPRFGGLTNCFCYSFRDSITAGCVIFPARTFKPLAKPESAASAASTP